MAGKDYLVRAAALESYDDLVREPGGSPADLKTARALDCPRFGLLLSEWQGLDAFGVVGLVMQQADDGGSAPRHLRESGASMTELAHRVGYSELSAFSFAFRQRHGVSPRAWRRSGGLLTGDTGPSVNHRGCV